MAEKPKEEDKKIDTSNDIDTRSGNGSGAVKK